MEYTVQLQTCILVFRTDLLLMKEEILEKENVRYHNRK